MGTLVTRVKGTFLNGSLPEDVECNSKSIGREFKNKILLIHGQASIKVKFN